MAEHDWIKRLDPEYKERTRRAVYARDHYTGEVLEKVRDGIPAKKIERDHSKIPDGAGIPVGSDRTGTLYAGKDVYLYQRAQGEHIEAFRERAFVSRFPRHAARVVGSFLGRLDMVSERDERAWSLEDGRGLGRPEDPASRMHALWRDFDGDGANYPACLTAAARTAMVENEVAYMMAPPVTDGAAPRLVLLRSEDVLNRYPLHSQYPAWVVLREGGDQRPADPRAKLPDGLVERRVLITPERFDRFEIEGDEVRYLESESGAWKMPIYRTPERGALRLPVRFVRLSHRPVSQGGLHAGYQMALGANYLYNLLSDWRNNVRQVTHNLLTADVEDRAFENSKNALAEGHKVLQGAWAFIGPQPGYTAEVWAGYQDEVQAFYAESFQNYESVARERTATEVRQEQSSGQYAFLSLLAQLLDEIENDWLFLASQYLFPNDPDLWNAASVHRKKDFRPVDPHAEARALAEMLFSEAAPPAPASAFEDAYRKLFAALSLSVPEEDAKQYAALLAASKLSGLSGSGLPMGPDQIAALVGEEHAPALRQLLRQDFTQNGVEQ